MPPDGKNISINYSRRCNFTTPVGAAWIPPWEYWEKATLKSG